MSTLFDIVLIESAKLTSEDITLTELGRTINSKHETYLRQAAKLLVKVLQSVRAQASASDLLDDGETDDDPANVKSKDAPAQAKEAGTFNQSDTMSLLQAALTQTQGGNGYDTYISDVYEDQGYFVYRKGYSGGYFKIDFAIATNGAVTLGNPESVVRKVTYISPSVPTSESSRAHDPVDMLETAIEEAVPVKLVEKAVASDGTVMLKLIAPGKGSSGYYTQEVLKRDGPRVFTKGLHNFIDHPTPQEESERPEGSLTRLGSTLIEDAHWLDAYRDASGKDAGPGLYARAKVQPGFAESLDTIADNIGTSIRAMGKARMGTIGDYKGPIIEAITSAKSVDYVTMAGAGGKVLSLVESARNARQNTGDDMGATEEIAALRETVDTMRSGFTAMQEALARSNADKIVDGYLTAYPTMPQATRAKLVAMLTQQAPLTEARNAIDVVAFGTLIESTIKAELDYLQSVGAALGVGAIRGFGSADPLTESQPPNYEDQLVELFSDQASFGMSESAAKIAARGR